VTLGWAAQYDKEGKGHLDYEPLMKMLLDADYYPLYEESCSNTQAQLGADKARHVQEQLRVRCQPKAQKLQQVSITRMLFPLALDFAFVPHLVVAG
jgi:hypothetical protein